jgi:hypothetical protein
MATTTTITILDNAATSPLELTNRDKHTRYGTVMIKIVIVIGPEIIL